GGAARRDADGVVARDTERLHLAQEERGVAVVVGDRRDDAGPARQRDRRQAAALRLEAADELGDQVFRVAGAAAIAEGQNLATAAEGCGNRLSGGGHAGQPARTEPLMRRN